MTSFKRFLEWIEEATGYKADVDRCALVEAGNAVREEFYLQYSDLPLFDQVEGGFSIQKFCHFREPEEYYYGITLPVFMQSIEAAWSCDVPFKIYSGWREWRDGIKPSESCRLQILPHGRSPIERDMKGCCKLKFFTYDERDTGKPVTVRYVTTGGEEAEETVRLVFDNWISTERQVLSLVDNGLIFDPDRKGGVKVADGDLDVLAYVPPGMDVPSFRRYKFTGVKPGDYVWVRASRLYTPLYWDNDVCELSVKAAAVSMAKGLRHLGGEGDDLSQEQKGEYHHGRAKSLMQGAQSRESGKATIHNINLSKGPVRSGRLKKSGQRKRRY